LVEANQFSQLNRKGGLGLLRRVVTADRRFQEPLPIIAAALQSGGNPVAGSLSPVRQMVKEVVKEA
jgi:hypothetical protein